MADPMVVTVADAARALAVSELTVRRMLSSGELHAVRLRRTVRVPVRELEAVARGRAEPKEQ